ncbi:AraC family transcriptional regulator [Pontibacter sp. SGAir0037]|uniref:AraC family transcriptional regulator n=1 Tax=Pontibacter sp. SGAir0037 TaxID=2571030 RepID=UPI0010CCCF0F|nr:AraC family transcriptional regulator [Pontibacter sp. SGAir0037]QCR24454.1 AraC family transcriptional regulator [Pontibacter sp. SGAir0037]
MQPHEHTLSASSVNLVLHVLQLQGYRAAELCREAGIAAEQLQDVNARVTIAQMVALWKEAARITQNPNIALQIGEAVNPTSAGIIAYVMMNAPDLHESIRKLCKYQDIVCEGIQTSFEVKRQEAHVVLQVVSPALTEPRYAIDCEMVIYSSAFAALVGEKIPFKQISFAYPKPDSTEEHQRIFDNAELLFDMPQSGFVFDAEWLAKPVVSANPELNLLFEQYANEYLQRLREPKSITERVQRELAQLLKGEEPTITTVSRNLALSIRSLQAKLQEEGTSYQAQLDEVRKELAIRHLKSGMHTVSDVAYLLGFSEPSAFSHSFKKWTGLPPQLYRQQVLIP